MRSADSALSTRGPERVAPERDLQTYSVLVTRRLRSQWVVVLPGLGAVAMFAVMLVGWAQTRSSAELLLRGEGDLLLDRVQRPLRDTGEFPTDEVMALVLAGVQPPGLKYLAMVRPDGVVLASAGTPPEGFEEARRLHPGAPLRRGGLAWVRSRPLPPGPGGPGFPPPGGGPPDRGPSLLIAFEPHLATQLDRTALATLLAGSLGALGLLALSVFARRLLAGRDEALQRLEYERRLASLGTMSGVVAHELRNPLASLKGHAQLLVESLEEPKQKAQAQHVVDAAWRLERLSASLLELARTGALTREVTEPVALVRAVLAQFEAQRTRLEVSAAPAKWSLDPVRFQQVVTNLVDNALQASPPEALVELKVAQVHEALIIEVRDHGPGVPVSERERVFEPFVTTRIKGVGLGLAIARQVVALHGGTLTVEDAPGGGACFRITIPAD